MSTPDKRILNFQKVILRTAVKFKIPIGLVFAICKVESDFVATAMSWNPILYHKVVQPRGDEIPFEEAIGWAVRFGLMGITGHTARQMGYRKDLTGLWQPIININYGCKYLNKLLSRYTTKVEDAVAAFHTGIVRKTELGGYVNQGYVDKVMNMWKDFQPNGELAYITKENKEDEENVKQTEESSGSDSRDKGREGRSTDTEDDAAYSN